MSRISLHCMSLVLGYYPILPEMFWSSGFLIFRRKNRWKMIFDGSYGKLFSRSFSFYFSTDFSIHSFLNNSWGNLVYKRNQGVECHGNHRTQLCHMQAIEQPLISIDLKFFINQMKLRYLKSILQSRSSLLPSYCRKIPKLLHDR